jgi:HSP20 family protein
MSMIWRDPFETLTPLRDAMGRLFEESFVGPRFELVFGRTFPVDVYEDAEKKSYIVEASLPGFKPEEIQVTVEGDTLLIQAKKEKEEEIKSEKGNYVRRERYEGEMSRVITLSTMIDASKAEATYEHGLLKLYIPKTEQIKAKQIPIKVKQLAGVA